MTTKSANAVYGRLVRDERISHGAFRLWHLLRSYADQRGNAWPRQETIAAQMHCKKESIRGWLDQLISGGYLTTRTAGKNHHFVYTLRFGGPPNGTAKDFSRSPSGSFAVPLSGLRGPPNGTVTNPSELNPITKSTRSVIFTEPEEL